MHKSHDFVLPSRLLFCIDSSTLKLVVCGSFFFAGGTDNVDVIKNMLILQHRGDNVDVVTRLMICDFYFGFCQELSVSLPCIPEYSGKSHKTIDCTVNNLIITLLK